MERVDFEAMYPNLIADHGYIEHPKGWDNLVDKMFEEISAKIAGTQVRVKFVQTKEKFGGLRAYFDSFGVTGQEVLNDLYEIVSKAQDESYKVCQECGKPGVLRNTRWLKTLCDDHSMGAEPTNNPF